MTSKPAPRTVHHPLTIGSNMFAFRRSRSRRSRVLLRPRSRTPHDAHFHALGSAAPAMCSPFGAHLRDLRCAVRTFVLVLRRSRSPCRWVATFRVRPSTITSCSPSRCFAFALVFRRSRSHPRSGCDVVRSCERPSPLPSRVHALVASFGSEEERAHLLVLVSGFVFRRSRPVALRRLTVHGLARSCHVSTAHSSDPLSVRGPPLCAAPVNRVRARLATITFALPYGFLQRITRLATCSVR